MKLKKELNLLNVFCIASGAMISSGLFILPGLAHARTGPSVMISYLIAGLLALTGMLSQAELVSAMPKAGGTYFYVVRSMGPAVGTVDGLVTWLSLTLKSAFALIGMAAFTGLITPIDIKIIAIILCLFFIVLNLIGIKEAGFVQIVIVTILLLILLYYVFRGVPVINVANLEPFSPGGIGKIFSTAGFVFVSYGGLLKIASIAEEVKDPGKNIPIAMILSLVVVTILYFLVVLVTTGVLDGEILNKSLTPISDGAEVFLGHGGRLLLSIAALLAFISTANAGIMAASRYPLALSRDGLLPDFVMNISAKYKTPYAAILITGLVMIVSLFLKLQLLVEFASTALILTYIFSCLCVIIMRESHVQNYKPSFSSPLYPWIQIIGIIGFGFLMFEMGSEPLILGLILIVISLFVYWFYGRIRTNREFALLHLVERLIAKELTTHSLETELKEIIRERDDITKDRFDKIIEKSKVIDVDGPLNNEEFFKIAAHEASECVNVSEDKIFDKLLQREKESTTVIDNGIAIPHIIIEGNGIFTILLARCKQGIDFCKGACKVHTVFILIGTRDERNFHLRALSAIAQIVQDPHFDKHWLKAKNEESLRDIILLGERKRQ
ncbi:MAG: amino acid permease [Elusimicrobiota bacterium]